MDDPSQSAFALPIPRRSRECKRDRERNEDYNLAPSLVRRSKPPHAISTVNANRFRDCEDDRVRFADASIPPASPEVISSLITSLSAISNRTSLHFENPSYFDRLDAPPSQAVQAGSGSFGVDYGAFVQPSLLDLEEENVLPDELAASPPVIRTSKPPSGYFSLSASKSPRSCRSPNRDGTGLKKLRSGRPSNSAPNVSRSSSRGSLVSVDESIGNPSIERSYIPATRSPQRQRSGDNWGMKTGRQNSRVLMCMSSKEALRERETDKQQLIVGGAVAGSSSYALAASRTRHLDSLMAEAAIYGKPLDFESRESWSPAEPHGWEANAEYNTSPRPIPIRDSSLRLTGLSTKRTSAPSSRALRRDSEFGAQDTDAIQELGEHGTGKRHIHSRQARRRSKQRPCLNCHPTDPSHQSVELARHSKTATFSNPHSEAYITSNPLPVSTLAMAGIDIDQGAPFPSVSQGRRRDRESSSEARGGQRGSGRQTPDYLGGYSSEGGGMAVKLKRSSSRQKRLSGVPSQAADPAWAQGTGANGPTTKTDQAHIAYERRRSADSIDEAVESYLCSSRLSQTIRHAQTGRVISFSEVGDPNGSAVFCCVGMGLTRYITAFYDELALTLKLRLITPDRPGIGDSEAMADGTATPLSWPDDVCAICQSLKITKFSILAHSAGAIYALATALRMPQHIRGRIHLLAPWIPPSQMTVLGTSAQIPLPPTNAIPTSQRILRALPTPILKVANSSFMTTTSSSITSSLPKQKRTKRERRPRENKDTARTLSKPAATDKENDKDADVGGPSLAAEVGEDVSASLDQFGFVTTNPTDDTERASAGAATLQENGAPNGPQHQVCSPSRRTSAASHGQSNKEQEILSAAARPASSPISDRERQQTYDTRLTHAIWQLATTGANPAVDLLVCLERRHTIGFRYVDITRPVIITHGTRDSRVPVDNVKWLAKTMRRCEVRILEGEGHGLMASAQVMGNTFMEISKEWEEWKRVTGATKRENEHLERSQRGTIGQAR